VSPTLKVESMVAAIPPDALIPIFQNIREESHIDTADELLHEDEELEHPGGRRSRASRCVASRCRTSRQ
jgi:hypothetical protein